jgi:hypothetical protein
MTAITIFGSHNIHSNMLAKNAYVQIYMQDKLTQNDIRFQQHSYCNTNINVGPLNPSSRAI